MSIWDLHRIFFPSSVAVLGADEAAGPLAGRILKNMSSAHFRGRIYAVGIESPAGTNVEAVADLAEIGQPVDLAILSTTNLRLPAALEKCCRAGVGGVVALARERRPAGLDEKLAGMARAAGVRLIGPRSWGVVSPWAGLNAAPGERMAIQGRLAVMSQSAAVCAGIVDLSLRRRVGLSFLIGLGDMIDMDPSEVIDYLASHFRVGAILIHLESIPRLRRFMSSARAAARIKPIVILKTNRTGRENRTARTGAGGLIEQGGSYDAAFKRAGIIRVETVEELFDCGMLVGNQPRPLGPGLAVMTNVRSPGIMAVDALARRGLVLAELDPGTVNGLASVLPPSCDRKNPIVIRAEMGPARWGRLLEICLGAREINGILIILSPRFLVDAVAVAKRISESLIRKAIPVFTVWMGGEDRDEGRGILEAAGLPTYDSPERAVEAFAYLYDFEKNQAMLRETPGTLPGTFRTDRDRARAIIDVACREGGRMIGEPESLDLLACYDIPVLPSGRAGSADEAAALASAMGRPVTLKGPGPGPSPAFRLHRLAAGLRGGEEVLAALARIGPDFTGQGSGDGSGYLLVQPDQTPDLMLRVGCLNVPGLGPVMMFGQGGVRAEASTDQALGLPPLNQSLARRMMEQTRIFRLMTETAWPGPGASEELEALLVRFSHLVTDFAELAEMEAALQWTGESGFVVSEAVCFVRPSDEVSPGHLIIRPYPDEYETRAATKGGLELFLRPVKPEDASMLQALWATLSPKTVYYRFSTSAKELTADLLARYTQIDYDREIVMVAIEEAQAGERMLGVARLSGEAGAASSEFAVIVGDPWQGQGVGALLLGRLVDIAARRHIRKIWGLVLRENRSMLELARGIGCTMFPTDDPTQVEVGLDVSARKDGTPTPNGS
ncbi:MAG: bifunctional acetate--CoA ligase family protein/GNAT family N-acetyltransferase [Proteobacteria bacterium]|nr:bifunctional acetate--CoA ligase family protein/GNAT family N-acetyltransferase [Pseudomonadota bacterium]